MDHATELAEFTGSQLPPKLKGQRRRGASLFVLALFLAAGLVAVLFFFDPRQHGFYPLCYFHVATGLNCPGCGGLRAAHQLLHGHIIEAARFNLLLVVALPFLMWVTARFIAARWRGQSTASLIRSEWLWTALFVAAVFTVLRNLPIPAFSWMSP